MKDPEDSSTLFCARLVTWNQRFKWSFRFSSKCLHRKDLRSYVMMLGLRHFCNKCSCANEKNIVNKDWPKQLLTMQFGEREAFQVEIQLYRGWHFHVNLLSRQQLISLKDFWLKNSSRHILQYLLLDSAILQWSLYVKTKTNKYSVTPYNTIRDIDCFW